MKIQISSLVKCSIFTAESQAILYAVKFTRSIKGVKKKEIIKLRSDSQAVLRALEHTVITDPMLKVVKDKLRSVGNSGINILLRWVPSHADIEGNIIVNMYAKIGIDSVVIRDTAWVKRDLKANIRKKICDISEAEWNTCGSCTPKLFFPDSKCFNMFIKSLPSVELCQLVSGHYRLHEFLYNKLAVISSPMCACGEGDETVSHYLLECSLYEKIRYEVWEDFDPTFSFIRKDWKKVDEYIKKTKRFQFKT